jgi:hypothetical protein
MIIGNAGYNLYLYPERIIFLLPLIKVNRYKGIELKKSPPSSNPAAPDWRRGGTCAFLSPHIGFAYGCLYKGLPRGYPFRILTCIR